MGEDDPIMAAPAKTPRGLSATERVLRIFTDIRPGEGQVALLLFADVFLILCSYYFVKPLREGWISVSSITSLSKMEVKAYSSFGQSALLLPVVWYYGRLADRYRRSDLILRASLFCIVNMAIFWVIQPEFFIENLPGTGIAFYLWVGMFGVFVVAQFWAFAADVYTDEQGRRLIPLVAIGATAGAAMGSWITDVFVSRKIIPTEYLLIVAMVPLALSILLTRWVDGRTSSGGRSEPAKRVKEGGGKQKVEKGRGALGLVFRTPFLLAVGGITLLLSWVNTNGENLLFSVVQGALEKVATSQGVSGESAILEFTRDGTTAFYGNFFFWVNICALFLQAVVASRLLKYGGFGMTLLMLPVIALISYSTMWVLPVLAVVKAMKVAENATDYSINNTARHVLWLPVSAEMKYKGKPAIDSLFVRVGDGLAALTVLVGVQFLEVETRTFFGFNVLLVLAWIALSVIVVRMHREYSAAHERPERRSA